MGTSLKSLSIQQFGIYKDVVIEFNDGLNVISGETGSGKSLIINALSAIRGLRIDSSYVRSRSEKAKVSAIFEVDDVEYQVARTINSSGKTTSMINNEIVALSQLNETAAGWFDVIGQNSSQIIFESDYILKVLDDEATKINPTIFDSYKKLWSEYQSFLEINNKYENKQQLIQKQDFLKFQQNEISEIDFSNIEELLNINEKIKLIVEQNENKETVLKLQNQLDALQSSCFDALKTISNNSFLEPFSESIQTASNLINDIAIQVQTNVDDANLDSEINRLMSTKYALDNLLIKYGPTIEDLIATNENIINELNDINDVLDLWDIKNEKKQEYIQKLNKIASTISELRKKYADLLSDNVKKTLEKLLMEGSSIQFKFTKIAPTAAGTDEIQLFVETNQNEGLKPIEKAASGGELARILLALWQNISSNNTRDVLICDEIDAGIGGETGIAIGKEMKRLSQHRQLICVTHLPQVAACADENILVTKHFDTEQNRALSKVTQINRNIDSDSNSMENELARMLSGSQTEFALEHARELLVDLNNVD